jgi:dienelactone hydrolase
MNANLRRPHGRSLLFFAAACAALACLSLYADDPPEAPSAKYDHRKLLVYRDDRGRELPVRTRADWSRRRAHILAGMQEAMGPLPSRKDLPPLDPREFESVAADGYTRHRISFVAEGTDCVPAYLLVPEHKPGERLPAMLALHQTTNIGKDEPAGMGPNANLHYGHELARRGYIVLAPDYPSFGDYPYDFGPDGYDSGTMKGIFNHLRGVDLLAARDDVDADRIGVIGHSLGGHNAMFAAAFDERLKVVVSSCGWTPFHDYYGGDIAGWTSDRYMPRLRDVYGLSADGVPFDFYEVVASFAPRAFFSCSPLHDDNFDAAGVRKGIAAAREVYDLFEAGEALQVRYPDSKHDFPEAVRLEAYAFIDRVLEHKPRQNGTGNSTP